LCFPSVAVDNAQNETQPSANKTVTPGDKDCAVLSYLIKSLGLTFGLNIPHSEGILFLKEIIFL